ncbi:YHS domain protein [Defluviimonas sp. WL0050]|uniref:YHS domain protein n=1 Tax=Albidovulum litorale TaxID=2984134 RepID=A0ABT2ZPX5_9RHOB|nr:YHS domain-containing (seleno)protein [Defluviimonas sp. WL0050]MCV2873010.1 YHS domain protein [Defluviimonas sp. WL0050]
MTLTRRALIAAILVIPVAGTILRPALAAEPEVYAPNGVAMGGYDPVAYFTDGRPVMGKAAHALRWRGALWYFASAEAMESFEMNPAGYAPQYGGYCAYAMSKGAIAPTVPEAFTVHDGRLYMNFSTEVRTIWSGDIPGNIALANGNWPAALGQ